MHISILVLSLFMIVAAALAQPISNTSTFPADFGPRPGMSQGALPCQDIAASVTAPWCRTEAGPFVASAKGIKIISRWINHGIHMETTINHGILGLPDSWYT